MLTIFMALFLSHQNLTSINGWGRGDFGEVATTLMQPGYIPQAPGPGRHGPPVECGA